MRLHTEAEPGFLTRAIAWTFPLMGREGALNQLLIKAHIISNPIDAFGFSTLSVRLAMIQLYVLFMVTPLFFSLAQVDRSALEAARDLGANWWRTFREVILPQTMPGVVIGSIFIFVLTMGDYGTVSTVGGGNITSVGTLIYSDIGAIAYPQGAASAVLLVFVTVAEVTPRKATALAGVSVANSEYPPELCAPLDTADATRT